MDPTDHPAVVGYLTELDRLLADAPAVDRAAAIGGVHARLRAALPRDPGPDAVERAVLDLGPPRAQAAAAYAGPLAAPPGTRPPRPPRAPLPARERTWLPVAALVVQALLLGAFLVAYAATRPSDRTLPTVVVLGLLLLPGWLVLAGLGLATRLWGVWDRVVLLAAYPLLLVVAAAAPAIGYALGGVDGRRPASVVALAVGIVGFAVTVGLARLAVTTRDLDRAEA